MSSQNKHSMSLVIKLNQSPMPNDCPLCGTPTNPNIGAELFLAGTESVVCLDCGMKHAPILATLMLFADYSRLNEESGESLGNRLINYHDLSKTLVCAERQFGTNWEDEQNFKRSPMNAYQSID